MKPIEHAEAAAEPGTVSELLERRTQIEQWLARLSDTDPDVPARVVERVRADYLSRLDDITSELSSHRTSIEDEVQRLDEELASATREHDEAVEALAEARLRQRIGEISETDWNARRPELEEAVESATAARSALEEETARIRDVLTQLQAADPAVEVDPSRSESEDEPLLSVDFSPHREPAMLDAEGELVLPSLDDFNFDDSADAISLPGAEFLEELDRAISDANEKRPEPAAEPDPDATVETADAQVNAAKGLKCAECGYTNDPTAWYCGVCGVDLT